VLVPPALIAGGHLSFPVVSHDSAPWIEFRRLKHQSDSFRSAATLTIGNPSDRLQEEFVGVLLSSLFQDLAQDFDLIFQGGNLAAEFRRFVVSRIFRAFGHRPKRATLAEFQQYRKWRG
jgi:hypothetical protein